MPWTAESFGPVGSELVEGVVPGNFTYPQFYTAPTGRLQMLYRLDYSGNGDWYIAEYTGGESSGGTVAAAGRWTVLGMLFSRVGVHGASMSRCAYPNPIRYDTAGRLHVTWCWREHLGLAGNHDLCYAYSDDCGRTWYGNVGDAEPVAVLSDDPAAARAIALDTPGIIFQPIPEGWGMMNVTTQCIDSRGRLHVAAWQNALDAAGPNMDMNAWTYVHYRRGADGTWQHHHLPFAGRKPQLAVGRDGTAFLVFEKGPDLNYQRSIAEGRLMVAMATEASGWTDWSIAWESAQDFIGEPLLDNDRWQEEEILCVYAQEYPSQPGMPSALHVLEFAHNQETPHSNERSR